VFGDIWPWQGAGCIDERRNLICKSKHTCARGCHAQSSEGSSQLQLPHRQSLSVFCSNEWHRPKSFHVAVFIIRPVFMRSSLGCYFCILAVVFALGDDSNFCPDATLLLPFVSSQIEQGMSLVIFQGTAVPQVWGLRCKLRGLGTFSLLICTHANAVRVRCGRMER
jgi:hypothetical protein